MKKILIIANPTSGESKGKEFSEDVENVFNDKDYQTKKYMTTGNDDFEKLTQESMSEGFTTVALIGGDGTVSEYVNQIAELKNRPKILLLPLGTTNNFARTLESEINDDKLLEKIKDKNFTEQQADIGKINDNYFVSTVSIGTVPEVAWKTEDSLKEEIGSLAYMFEGIKVLGEEYNYFDTQIKTESAELNEKDTFLIIVGLSNSVFGIPIFFEDAELDDGKLHVYILRKGSVKDVTESIAKRILNEKDAEENDLSFSGSFKQAKLVADTDLISTVDGEKGPGFPIELSVLHNHLTFLFLKKDNLF